MPTSIQISPKQNTLHTPLSLSSQHSAKHQQRARPKYTVYTFIGQNDEVLHSTPFVCLSHAYTIKLGMLYRNLKFIGHLN